MYCLYSCSNPKILENRTMENAHMLWASMPPVICSLAQLSRTGSMGVRNFKKKSRSRYPLSPNLDAPLKKKSKRRRVRGGARKSAANNQRKTAKEKANSAVVDCQPPALFCFFLAKRLPSLFFFRLQCAGKKERKREREGNDGNDGASHSRRRLAR